MTIISNESYQQIIDEVKRINVIAPNALLVEPTGATKTTLINSFYCDELQALLSIREGESKAIAKSAKMIVTDSELVPSDKLIVVSKQKLSVNQGEIDDDNEMIINILSSLIRSKKNFDNLDEEIKKEVSRVKTTKDKQKSDDQKVRGFDFITDEGGRIIGIHFKSGRNSSIDEAISIDEINRQIKQNMISES